MNAELTNVVDERPAPRYADLFRDFTPEELRLLPQIKRFFECFEGDKELRDALIAGTATEAQMALLREIGITFDLEELAPAWREPELFLSALDVLQKGVPSEEAYALLRNNPILDIWTRFLQKKNALYIIQRKFCTKTPSKS